MANLYIIISDLAIQFIIINILVGGNAAETFNIQTYGAVGDGVNDDSEAFTNAWNAACNVSSATLLVPDGTSIHTDGIDINGQSTDFRIINCKIGTGDDCVSIGNGSSNIYIEDLTCGPGHGISVGSLGKGNTQAQVSNVHVNGATLTATTNGLRIKTWQGGSGSANGIIFEKVTMDNVANPIIIDQYYCDSPTPCSNQSSAVKISNVTYNGISGTSSTPVAVRFACSTTVGCTDITLSDISLRLKSGGPAQSYCLNAQGQTSEPVDPPSCLSS
ncbi:hypothetical protein SUGI_0122260 [Cryptomeria japonica]|nr:hypothetical protein SUGI_0122260 [Cryptomeria japonica]